MFWVSTAPIIRSTQNCNYSLRYWSYFLCSYLPPTWPSIFRVSTTPIMSTQNCNYSLRCWSYFLCSYLPPTWSSIFRVSTTPIMSTQNCNYSLRYWSYICIATSAQRGQVSFGCQPHPSSGVQKPVTTASGTGHIFCAATSAQRGQVSFGCQPHPSWVHKTVTTASGTGHIFCAATSLQRGQVATMEGGSCTKNMTSTRGCSYSFLYSWWWVWLTPETCRVNLENNQ